MTKAATTKGNKQCRAKKRVRVGLETANPPQTHSTKVPPKRGIADNRLVITVAAQ